MVCPVITIKRQVVLQLTVVHITPIMIDAANHFAIIMEDGTVTNKLDVTIIQAARDLKIVKFVLQENVVQKKLTSTTKIRKHVTQAIIVRLVLAIVGIKYAQRDIIVLQAPHHQPHALMAHIAEQLVGHLNQVVRNALRGHTALVAHRFVNSAVLAHTKIRMVSLHVKLAPMVQRLPVEVPIQ